MINQETHQTGKHFRADCHVHIYTSWNDVKYEAGPRDLITLTQEFSKRGLGAATITSFNDHRFDKFMETAKDLPYDWQIEDSDIGAVIKMPDGKKFYWFNSDEKPTKQGHILLIGNKRESPHIKSNQDLGETLEKAQSQVSMIIADHPLMRTKDIRNSGIGEENLHRFREYFIAGELNGNCRRPFFRSINKDTFYFCEVIDLPVVANSDA